jgi:hypothetical protein
MLDGEQSIRRENLILVPIKEECYPCVGAPMETSGEFDSLIPQQNIIMLISLSLHSARGEGSQMASVDISYHCLSHVVIPNTTPKNMVVLMIIAL